MKRTRIKPVLGFLGLLSLILGAAAWAMNADARQIELNLSLANALKAGDIDAVRKHIGLGADPNIRDDYALPRETLLESLKRTLLHRPRPSFGMGVTPLMIAAAFEDLALVRLLLERGADPKATVHGSNALMFATGAEDVCFMDSPQGRPESPTAVSAREVIRALLEAGCNPNQQQDLQLDTPFQIAIDFEDDEIDRLFLQHGADWRIKDRFAQSALTSAVSSGRVGLVKRFLSEGADPNEANNRHHESVLELAAWKGSIEVLRVLLDAGANVNHRSASINNSALLVAVHDGKGPPEVVKLLLERGADVTAKAYDGTTVQQMAEQRGDPRIIALIKEARRN